ncbi:nucleolar protein dao-5 isoform X4 [Thunnus albacares]|uniref:nucleolar protein dao-5 isoform X4 n=1 Tax=Thunnus albacares TaxID=8236 RepID=UPI001CF6FD47|nr:nucleolar protein dao-5 isoform X4 [Thunnus albacares]
MAVAYGAVTQPGLFSQQYPPPLLPKPGKDNLRLQKLLKRTAKKKASAQASQNAGPFRSSLSPVNEASPDLERSDHSTPPRTPETPFSFYSVQQPPRITIRPLYQHVASPYPQRAAYGRAARFSPQLVATSSYSYSQHVTTVPSYSAATHPSGVSPTPGPVVQLAGPKRSLQASSLSEATAPVVEVKRPAFSTFPETHPSLRPATAVATTQPKPISPGPTPYPTTGGQALIRPLVVLTPLVRTKSPRPTFKATEPSRSPKPMFDVPQIRMYTASTSYYETSRTPPVYDTAGLTAIGSTMSQPPSLGTDPHRKTPTLEIKRGTTPTAEISTVIIPASEIKRTTPTAELKRATPTSEIKRATPTSELKRATPTSEITRATPTSEIKRATPTSELKRATPTSEITRATPTSEIKRATPTSELKRATQTEIKTVTSTSERAKTPTYEIQISRISAGRPKTPAYHMTRAPTPVFEISRPNPLLFAVSPVKTETERSGIPKTVSAMSSSSASQTVETTEPKPTETILNGDIHSDMTHAAKPIQQIIKKSKSEPDLVREKLPTAPAGSQRPKTPTFEPTTPVVTSFGFQRSKTPTYEASRLMATLPSYKRPRTPTYGTSLSGVSPVAFPRPKTPTQLAHKSSYRGLTPAEYAAYGGIKTYSPAFGITSSKTVTQEEVKATKEESAEFKTTSQEPSVTAHPTAEVTKVKETPKDVDKPQLRDESVSATPSIPIIVVSQASDTSATTVTQETSKVSSQVAAKQEQSVVQETPKAKPPTAEGKTPEKEKKTQKVETPVQEVAKPKAKTPEAKHPPPKADDQDPLKAVRKLLGKVQTGTTETKVSEQKEPAKPKTPPKPKIEGSKPSTAVPALPVKVPAESKAIEDKGKDKKAETSSVVKSTPMKKEGDEVHLEAEPLLKVIKKPKGLKSNLSGWSRLKKHMVVEQEEPKFPETGPQKEATEQDQKEEKKVDDKAVKKPDETPGAQDENQTKDTPKATQMWDAVLFQMFSTKENIMHQIELSKTEEEKQQEIKDEPKEIPSFAFRLPVLLFSPKFDAKRLKEAASRPVTKISTVFEMGLIGRKGKDEEPKDFNRTARGFNPS